jgi:riboflavin synthase
MGKAAMFSGIVQALGTVARIEPVGAAARIFIRHQQIADGAKLGHSIAVNGCCLTVIDALEGVVGFDAVPETLSRTNLGDLAPGSQVNLETSLQIGDELGGHFVTGHIDGGGTVDRRLDEDDWSTIWFKTTPPLTRQMASKGSIAIDGISMTLVDVEEERFSVAVIPHTLQVTTLGIRQPGDRVNLETDVLAKYVERQLQGWA